MAISLKDRLAAQAAAVQGTEMYQNMEVNAENMTTVDVLRKRVEAMSSTSKVWSDFHFRNAAKFAGLLRTIAFDFPKQDQMLHDLGLQYTDIAPFAELAGQLPYYSSKENAVIEGYDCIFDDFKDYLKIMGTKLGVLVEDSDLKAINADTWSRLKAAALAKAEKEYADTNKMQNTAATVESIVTGIDAVEALV